MTFTIAVRGGAAATATADDIAWALCRRARYQRHARHAAAAALRCAADPRGHPGSLKGISSVQHRASYS
eukprot:4217477-Pleurochrysis_carterae.AAC.2